MASRVVQRLSHSVHKTVQRYRCTQLATGVHRTACVQQSYAAIAAAARHSSTSAGIEQHIVKSPVPRVPPLPDNVLLPQYVLENCAKYDKKVALVDGMTGRSMTYSSLLDHVTSTAASLIQQGLKPRDVVTLFAFNGIDWVISFLAVTSVGAVCSAINPYYTPEELQYALSFSNSHRIIASHSLYPVVQKALSNMKQTEMQVILSGGSEQGCLSLESMYESSVDRSSFGPYLDKVVDLVDPSNDLVSLPFSSGTTGLPKAVMITHHNFMINVQQLATPGVMAYTEDDVFTGLLPFYHIYGQTVILLAGLRYGAKIVLLPKFEPEVWLKNLTEHRVTVLHTAPPLMLFLAKHPSVGHYDLTSIQCGYTGGAPIGQHTMDEAAERLHIPNARFAQVYGLTETSPVTNCNARHGPLVRADSIGFPVPNQDMKVIDINTGETLGPNQEGELCFRGPNVMKGYLNNEEATRSTIKDNWLHSGDIGYYDEQTFAFITDRLKELIKVKGYQVAPAELESLLLKHPAVSDTAVIGIPDDRAGEVPRAYVVLKHGHNATEKELKNFVKGKAAEYKSLRGGVEFTDEIPKSASGKILRRQIREAFKKKLS